MATKKNKLGFDPLAWMQDDAASENDDKAKAESVKMTPKKKSKSTGEKKIAKQTAVKSTKNVLGLEADILRRTFELLAPKADDMILRFYDELFERHPAVVPMFKDTTKAKQAAMLVKAISTVIENVDDPDTLVPVLQQMGARHKNYGVHQHKVGAVEHLSSPA